MALESGNKGYLWAGPAGAGPAPQALTFIDRARASPAPSIPHFYRQALGQPGPQPLTSIGQTPHFYLPGQAPPCQILVSPRTTGATTLRRIANINCTLPSIQAYRHPGRTAVGPAVGPRSDRGLTAVRPPSGALIGAAEWSVEVRMVS